MEKRKLHYRFHDPNPAGIAAAYILKVFVEANEEKVKKALQQAADEMGIARKYADEVSEFVNDGINNLKQ